jgi:simple sugar transport system permease protein
VSTGAALRLLSPLVAVASSLAVGALFILAIGQDPLRIYGIMAQGTLGTAYGWGQLLFKATPLVFTGLAVAVGFRAGLFNIGVEGQLYLGAFAIGVAGATLSHLPGIVLMPVCLAVGMASAAAWAAVPGLLKARLGSHEVINTIMMNFIAFALVSYFGKRLFVPETVRTPDIGAGAMLARLDVLVPALRGSPVNLSLGLALLACLVVGWLLFRTRTGYELCAVGLNPTAASYGGVNVGARQVQAMALSGALASFAGVNFVQGYKHFFELGFSAGVGFLGIAVALLGRNHPVGVLAAALFFGGLSYGGLVINPYVPKELVEILQAIVILFAITTQKLLEGATRSKA